MTCTLSDGYIGKVFFDEFKLNDYEGSWLENFEYLNYYTVKELLEIARIGETLLKMEELRVPEMYILLEIQKLIDKGTIRNWRLNQAIHKASIS